VDRAPLHVEFEEHQGALVLAPLGVLDSLTYADLRSLVLKAAVDEPRAVVVDVDGLIVPDPSAYALFTSLSVQLGQWPGVPLLVAAAGDRQRAALRDYRLARFVPVHRSVAAAVAAAHQPPVRRLARRELPNSLVSASLARQYVRELCLEWEVPSCVESAVLITNELVENTLLHTYCAPSLRLELRRGLLTAAVYDDDPALAEPVGPDAGRGGRGGLALVAELSTAWGCSPTRAGGKVVWAVLRP
jgi:anti-anti-sigma regulatory factor